MSTRVSCFLMQRPCIPLLQMHRRRWSLRIRCCRHLCPRQLACRRESACLVARRLTVAQRGHRDMWRRVRSQYGVARDEIIRQMSECLPSRFRAGTAHPHRKAQRSRCAACCEFWSVCEKISCTVRHNLMENGTNAVIAWEGTCTLASFCRGHASSSYTPQRPAGKRYPHLPIAKTAAW